MDASLENILNHEIPYRLAAIDVFTIAANYRLSWFEPKTVKIYFDDKLAIDGNSNAFINPNLEAGVIHCRALLEFLGLCLKSDRLQNIKDRRPDDIGIEHFSGKSGPLQMVTPEAATSKYAGGSAAAEQALMAVFHATNKGLAHVTNGQLLPELELLEIASRGIPSLIISYLYTPLGLPAPSFKIVSRVP